MMKRTVLWMCLLVLMGLVGCSKFGGVQEGSEEAARAHLAAEFDKWIIGQENEAETDLSRIRGLAAPLAYKFPSVVPVKSDLLGIKTYKVKDLPDDWESWPAYRFNVYVEWRSQADTPLEKVTTYTVTWDTIKKKWYVKERF